MQNYFFYAPTPSLSLCGEYPQTQSWTHGIHNFPFIHIYGADGPKKSGDQQANSNRMPQFFLKLLGNIRFSGDNNSFP
jgi:hypothetical protein